MLITLELVFLLLHSCGATESLFECLLDCTVCTAKDSKKNSNRQMCTGQRCSVTLIKNEGEKKLLICVLIFCYLCVTCNCHLAGLVSDMNNVILL